MSDVSPEDRMRRTLAGETRLDLGEVLSEAWRRSDGARAVLFGGFAAFYVALFAVIFVLGLVAGVDGAQPGGASALLNLIASAATYPFLAGVFMVGLRRAIGAPIDFRQLLEHYDRTLSLLALNVLMQLGIAAGLLLFVVPGIYLAVAWSLAMPLLIDRRMGVFEALEASRRLVTKHWFSVFALMLVSGLLLVLGVFTFGIAMIWVLPWTTIAFAILYRELAGVVSLDGDASQGGGGDAGDDTPMMA